METLNRAALGHISFQSILASIWMERAHMLNNCAGRRELLFPDVLNLNPPAITPVQLFLPNAQTNISIVLLYLKVVSD